MKKLLILSCGTNASYHFCKILKEYFSLDIKLIGVDINQRNLVPCCHLLDSFYEVPYSSDPSFIDVMDHIFNKERPDYILPSFDHDQKIFFNGSEILSKYGIISLSTPLSTLPYYENKRKMFDFLSSANLPIPYCYSSEDCVPSCNYIVKPIHGVGSQGVQIVSGNKVSLFPQMDYMIQEICSDPEITVECFKYNGYFSYVCRERIATKAGVCVKTKIFNDNHLGSICLKLSDLLSLPMYFNVQFMLNHDEKYVITDVNLRPAGGMSLSNEVGWDVVSAIGHVILNHPMNVIKNCVPIMNTTTYVVRAFKDITTQSDSIIGFDLDGTLLDSRCRHVELLKKILIEEQLNIDLKNLIDFKSNGKNNVDFLVQSGLPLSKAQEIQKKWMDHIEDPEYLSLDVLYPYSIDLLSKLSKCHKLILLTARNNKEGVINQLKKLDISKFFDDIFIIPSNPEVIINKGECLKNNHVSVYYGDTKSDFIACSNTGIKFIFMKNGFNSEKYVFGE